MARREPDLDVDLTHLDPVARWRAWMARVEAVLFASATPVARVRLAKIVGRDVVLNELLGDLHADLADRPYDVAAVGDGWMLRTRPAHAPAIRDAAALSTAATGLPKLREFDVVVLAAIATRQPVTRAELAEYFGRRIGAEVFARLQAHDVIATGPRSPTSGAPRTLVTTQAFLAMYGMRSLAEMGEGGNDGGYGRGRGVRIKRRAGVANDWRLA